MALFTLIGLWVGLGFVLAGSKNYKVSRAGILIVLSGFVGWFLIILAAIQGG